MHAACNITSYQGDWLLSVPENCGHPGDIPKVTVQAKTAHLKRSSSGAGGPYCWKGGKSADASADCSPGGLCCLRLPPCC